MLREVGPGELAEQAIYESYSDLALLENGNSTDEHLWCYWHVN